MSIAKSKTFQDVVKPLVYLNCLAGISTFRLPNQSKFTYMLMILYLVIITIISSAAIYVYLIYLKQITGYENLTQGALITQKVLATATTGFGAIVPLLVWLRREGLKNCLQEMLLLDNAFRVVRGLRNEGRKQYNLMICRVIVTLLIMILLCIYDIVTVPESAANNRIIYWSSQYAVHYQLLVMLVLDLNFCTFVGYLGQKFRNVNNNLLGLTGKRGFFTSCNGNILLDVVSQNVMRTIPGNEVNNTDTDESMNEKYCLLREARKAHLKLCKLTRKINCAYGIQNLLSIGISFGLITGILYTIYSAILWEKLTYKKLLDVIGLIIWTVIYAFRIWFVNYSCRSARNEAEKTGEVIYELLDRKVDRKFQQEIQEFGIQMLQNPVRFNACGFFPLDYTFVQGVIGSVTTYLIILIQMGPGSQRPSSYTVAADNGTNVLANN